MMASLNGAGPTETADGGRHQGNDRASRRGGSRYPFNLDSRLTSIDSNRSTMRWTRMPSMRTARITSNEIPNSTTNGMPGRDAHGDEKHRVLDRQQGEDLRDRLLPRHHQEQPNQQHRQGDADEMMADALRAFRKSRADAIADHRQAEADQQSDAGRSGTARSPGGCRCGRSPASGTRGSGSPSAPP